MLAMFGSPTWARTRDLRIDIRNYPQSRRVTVSQISSKNNRLLYITRSCMQLDAAQIWSKFGPKISARKMAGRDRRQIGTRKNQDSRRVH